jgi:hypothetical protein
MWMMMRSTEPPIQIRQRAERLHVGPTVGRRPMGVRPLSWPATVLLAVSLVGAALLTGCGSKSQNRVAPAAAPAAGSGNIAVQAVAGYGSNIHNSLEAGKRTECQSNLVQLRQAIQMQKDSEGTFPASLGALGSQLTSIEKCPSSGQPYQYDPTTGKVSCSTPGHENL